MDWRHLLHLDYPIREPYVIRRSHSKDTLRYLLYVRCGRLCCLGGFDTTSDARAFADEHRAVQQW